MHKFTEPVIVVEDVYKRQSARNAGYVDVELNERIAFRFFPYRH